MNENFGRISPRGNSVVPRGQEICRKCHEVAGLATTFALLGVRAATVKRVVHIDVNVRALECKYNQCLRDQLSRCSTARESSTGLFHVGPTKV